MLTKQAKERIEGMSNIKQDIENLLDDGFDDTTILNYCRVIMIQKLRNKEV